MHWNLSRASIFLLQGSWPKKINDGETGLSALATMVSCNRGELGLAQCLSAQVNHT